MSWKLRWKENMEILSRLQKLKQIQNEVNPQIRSWFEQQPSFDRAKNLERLEGCGTALLLREWIEEEGAITLKKANFCCQHLLCRTCATRRASKTQKKHSAVIRHALETFPNLIPVQITLTIKNGFDLVERFKHLADSLSSMLKAADNAKRSPEYCDPVEWNKVQGFVRAFEITNEGKGWHVHFHATALLSDFINVYKLSSEWLEITGDSIIVDVRRIYAKQNDESDDREQLDALDKAMLETFKYSLKFGDLSGEQIAEVGYKLRGRRFISSGGLLRGLKLEEDMTDEDLKGSYREFWGIWMKESLSYNLQRAGWTVPIS